MSDEAAVAGQGEPIDPMKAADAKLADLMGLDAKKTQWKGEDMAGLYRHQMRTALECDLKELISVEDLRLACAAAGIVTFGDLLAARSPPVEVVRVVKDFAKWIAYNRESEIPTDVGKVLYYAAIAVAQLRCGKKISRLDREELAGGIKWALSMPWLDEGTRAVLEMGEDEGMKGP